MGLRLTPRVHQFSDGHLPMTTFHWPVATGAEGYHFHQNHRGPGTHPLLAYPAALGNGVKGRLRRRAKRSELALDAISGCGIPPLRVGTWSPVVKVGTNRRWRHTGPGFGSKCSGQDIVHLGRVIAFVGNPGLADFHRWPLEVKIAA
jgi:hypothetical protein